MPGCLTAASKCELHLISVRCFDSLHLLLSFFIDKSASLLNPAILPSLSTETRLPSTTDHNSRLLRLFLRPFPLFLFSSSIIHRILPPFIQHYCTSQPPRNLLPLIFVHTLVPAIQLASTSLIIHTERESCVPEHLANKGELTCSSF